MPDNASSPIKVISLSNGSVTCEFATRLAVDAGMQVIKIEPAGGDPLRARPGHLFSFLAAGKQSVLPPAEAFERTLASLLQRCDAVVADEWGRDLVAKLAAGVPLIVVGERDATALQDILPGRSDEFLAFHGSGLGSLTPRVMPGYPSQGPLCPDAHLVEFLCGLYGAIALFGLLLGQRGGSASIGLAAAALPLLRREVAAILYEGAKPHRAERIWKVSPAEVHRCRDGWVFVDIIEDVQWVRLCQYLGRPELGADERYATREKRFAQAEFISAVLDEFFTDRPQSCWIEAQAQGIPVAPVNSLQDLVDDPQLAARGFWTGITNADGAAIRAPSTPLARLFCSEQERGPVRAAQLGEHTAQVLAELAGV